MYRYRLSWSVHNLTYIANIESSIDTDSIHTIVYSRKCAYKREMLKDE